MVVPQLETGFIGQGVGGFDGTWMSSIFNMFNCMCSEEITKAEL